MNRNVCLLAMFLLFASVLSQSDARDILVDNLSGDDRALGTTNPGEGTRSGPVRTLGKALRLARPGDRIVLAKTSEPYHESAGLFGPNNSGSGLRDLTIDGQGAVFDGSAPVPADAWHNAYGDLFRFRPERLGYQQLFLDGRPALRHPVAQPDGTVPPLEPREWCLTGSYVYFRVDAGRMPDQYALRYSVLPVGITLFRVHDVTIRNLVVQGYQLDGINVLDDTREIHLEGLLCRANGRSGISIGGASRVELGDCTLGDNGTMQLRIEGPAQARLWRCTLLDGTAPRYYHEGDALWLDGRLMPLGESPIPRGD